MCPRGYGLDEDECVFFLYNPENEFLVLIDNFNDYSYSIGTSHFEDQPEALILGCTQLEDGTYQPDFEILYGTTKQLRASMAVILQDIRN